MIIISISLIFCHFFSGCNDLGCVRHTIFIGINQFSIARNWLPNINGDGITINILY